MTNQKNQQSNQPLKRRLFCIVEDVLPPTGSYFNVSVEVKYFLGVNPISGSTIVLKRGVNVVGQAVTDVNGVCVIGCQFPKTDNGKTINLRVHALNRPEENSVNVNLPVIETPLKNSNKKLDKDPDVISLRSWIISDDGLTRLNIRVIGNRGIAMKNTKVKLVFEGKGYTVTTDDLGHAKWTVSRLVKIGEKIKIIGTVPGIAKETELKIWNAPVPTATISLRGLVARFSFVSLLIISGLSFFGLLVSFFMIFSKNSPNGKPSNEILWILFFVLCLIPPILLIINMVYYVVSNVIKRMKEKHDYETSRMAKAHSGDPRWENFMDAFKEIMKEKKQRKNNVSNKGSISVSSTGEAGVGNISEKQFFIMEFFNELFSEGIIHSISALFKKIFKK